jgi:hypothetical protein
VAKKTREAGALAGLKVLRTESESDLAKMLTDISEGIGPTDFFETTYVRDVAFYNWEMQKYQRIMTGILNNALPEALVLVLNRIKLPVPLSLTSEMIIESWRQSQIMAFRWLHDPEEQQNVLALLNESGLDESAIEAQAFKLVAKHLDNAHRMLSVARDGRDKALRSLVKHRKSLAGLVRQNADRVLAEDAAASAASVTVN